MKDLCLIDYGPQQIWWEGRVRHREDGPAVTFTEGGEQWWQKGQLHRDGGPAVVYRCGYEEWRVRGQLHCLTGPALVHRCGCWHNVGRCVKINPLASSIEWWVHGRQLIEEEFYRYVDVTTGEVFIPPGKTLTYDEYYPEQ